MTEQITIIERNKPEGLERRTDMFYEDFDGYMDKIELKMEAELKPLLKQVGIHAATKTDRKSLTVHGVIEKELILESWVPGWFEYERTFRTIVKELLAQDIEKIRFYVHVEPVKVHPIFAFSMYAMKYSFRYYKHR